MYRSKVSLALVMVCLAALLVSGTHIQADSSTPTPVPTLSSTALRINTVPWGDSWGSIAVYCTDPADSPSGIQILNPSGNILFSASNTAVAAAIKQATTAHPITISQGTNPTYKLTIYANGLYEITTSPDYEGKTYVASWSPECTPVGAPSSSPTSTPTKTCICSVGVGINRPLVCC